MSGEKDDLTAALAAEFERAEATDVSGASDAPATASPEPAAPAPSEPTTESDGRARDESGRFVKAAETPAPDAPKDAGTQATEAQAAPADQQQPVAPTTTTDDRPPVGLSAAIKGQWEKLPPEIRSEFIKRESDFHRGIDQYRQGHAMSQAWQQAVQPYMATIQSLGATPMQAVQYLFNADHQLRYAAPAQKVELFRYLAQTYGVDLGQMQGGEPTQVDPTIAQLQAQVQQLTQHFQSGQQAQTQQVQTEVMSEIDQFKADPKNVYFENVREDMAAMLAQGRANSLQDAYDKACWANPEVRSTLLAQQQQQSEAKRIQEAQAKVAHAKRAGFDVQGQGSVATSGNTALSLEQELANQWN